MTAEASTGGSPSPASIALAALARSALVPSDAARLLDTGLATDPAAIPAAVKLACHHLARAGLLHEGLAPESPLEALVLNAVAAGYAVGRRQLLVGGAHAAPMTGDPRDEAVALLERERRYDFSHLRDTLGPAVRSIQTELAEQTGTAAGPAAGSASRLAFAGFFAGVGLAAAEVDGGGVGPGAPQATPDTEPQTSGR